MRYARNRDLVEKQIVKALVSIGASVQQLNETGCPDLLVGFRGATYLIECKDQHGKAERHSKRTTSGLRESQEKWWAKWKGATPVVVTTIAEAFSAIGADVSAAYVLAVINKATGESK